MDKRSPAKDWYATAFNALYPIIYAHRTVAAAAPESAFAAEQLKLGKSDRVLDLCCGNGRHMVHMRKHAGSVTGLDYSADLLGIARETLGGDARLVRGDMRALPFDAEFDVLVNFFTSFGYFQTTAEDMQVASSIARALKPGGRFFMDYLNPAHVVANLVPRSTRESAGYTIEEARWIDAKRRRVNKRMRVTKDGAVVMESGESVRLYEAAEMEILLKKAGLEITRVHGNYDGTQLDATQPRMILVGRRIG